MATRFVLPSNLSYDDPIPFVCEKDPNTKLSVFWYIMQSIYLLLGTILNVLIIKNVFTAKNMSYRSNSFYVLYTADAIVSIIKCIIEVLISRVFAFITPLCSIFSPHFFTPSLTTKIYFILIHYCTSFRTISQIFMSLNRMTCVIVPLRHERIWKNILYLSLVTLFVIPFDTTWLIMLARVYVNPSSYGFSINYKEVSGLPKLSLIHVIECTIGFTLVIIFFVLTLIGLMTLENRLKSAEKSLTFVTMVMAFQTLIFASTQIYFAFFGTFFPEIRQTLFQAVPFISDSINVFSPVALIFTNRKLRSDIFYFKYFSQQGTSRSVSMTQQPTTLRMNSRVNIL